MFSTVKRNLYLLFNKIELQYNVGKIAKGLCFNSFSFNNYICLQYLFSGQTKHFQTYVCRNFSLFSCKEFMPEVVIPYSLDSFHSNLISTLEWLLMDSHFWGLTMQNFSPQYIHNFKKHDIHQTLCDWLELQLIGGK